MAVTKKLVKTIPYVKSSKVEKWQLEMQYENDSEGDATYYTSTFGEDVESVDPDNLTWYLVNAVKELSIKVEVLEKQLNNKE